MRVFDDIRQALDHVGYGRVPVLVDGTYIIVDRWQFNPRGCLLELEGIVDPRRHSPERAYVTRKRAPCWEDWGKRWTYREPALDPRREEFTIPLGSIAHAVEHDDAIHFLNREEFDRMSNESPFPIIVRRRPDGRLEIAQCSVEERVSRSFTEAEAIQRAEDLAGNEPAHDFFVCRAITRSKRTGVTTTRLA